MQYILYQKQIKYRYGKYAMEITPRLPGAGAGAGGARHKETTNTTNSIINI